MAVFQAGGCGRSALDRSQSLSLNPQRPDRSKILAATGVTRPEYALFVAIHYGITVSPAELPGRAVGEDYGSNPPITIEECRAALEECLTKGWLQVIDEPALGLLVSELHQEQVVGPIYGLPPVGSVDFTPAGARLWFQLQEHFRGTSSVLPFAFTDVVHLKTAQFFRTRVAALAETKLKKSWESVVKITEPVPIGPWRAQWWRRFPEGYRIDIEERMRWTGRASGSGTCCFMPYLSKTPNPQRLTESLNRHNVDLGEWLLLASAENGWATSSKSDLPWWIAEFASANFGIALSESDLRRGLESNLAHGWLRVVDQHAIDEVCTLLRSDPTIMPAIDRNVSQFGNFDFTLPGAALYRTIATDILGPDWEDNLLVQKGYYWEEHRYCESDRGLCAIVQERRDEGYLVRTVRKSAIGPWCVYWWERFPSGYLMELEIEEP
jgi:hypothetical protein